MRVLEVIQRSAEFLSRKGVDSARLQVELLLGHALKLPRLRLYLDFERELNERELELIRQFVKRRASREPLQHIVGSTSFCGLEIQVNRHVLIPRPETEVLAEHAWQFLNARTQSNSAGMSVLDFGTGSGCLALVLAQKVPAAEICALDLSHAAIEVARQNAARLGLASRIEFFEGDGLSALPVTKRFDLIVSNPPYIPSEEINALAPEVRDHDPRVALDGGVDGLQFLRRLAAESPSFMAAGGQLMCEFGDGQAEDAQKIFRDQQWQIAGVWPDLSGCSRILVARRAES